jgi:ERCC4 domain/Lsr2
VRRELLIARNPEPGSSLPYLLRVPVPGADLLLKARETWPRTSKVYCHRMDAWPDDAEVVERVAVRSCVKRGPAIDLVVDRARENRSQLVLAQARGREVIFWQSPRTSKQARPAVTLPSRRASGHVLEIIVDSRERYTYGFTHQQATTTRRALPVGDYAVTLDGEVVAAVERKSLSDLTSSLLSGKLTYALAELAALPRAAVVVEDRYSALFKLAHVAPGRVAEALAEAQARFPAVPVFFAETRALAQEWTYRFLGAALAEVAGGAASFAGTSLGSPSEVPPPSRTPTSNGGQGGPPTGIVRAWARANGVAVSDRGRVPHSLVEAYLASIATDAVRSPTEN